jgi:hypothetical protein
MPQQTQGAAQSSDSAQVKCWDRGRPARNEREARTRLLVLNLRSIPNRVWFKKTNKLQNKAGSGFALIAGGTPAVPTVPLSWNACVLGEYHNAFTASLTLLKRLSIIETHAN